MKQLGRSFANLNIQPNNDPMDDDYCHDSELLFAINAPTTAQNQAIVRLDPQFEFDAPQYFDFVQLQQQVEQCGLEAAYIPSSAEYIYI
jgi:hypothetical protein